MKFLKYQGAGNDFLIADNRDGSINLSAEQISALCDRRYGVGADGVMLLENAQGYDFKMVYYNSDGSGGMMCGNGGRCIVAFARDMGVVPANGQTYFFIAADGPHEATIVGETVRLKMKDVGEVVPTEDGLFLDTGTRHVVVPVVNIKDYPVFENGRTIRHKALYGPIGTNVNFTQFLDGTLHVRTFEKGVEDETYACGTGIVASAIAHAVNAGIAQKTLLPIKALRDELAVEFTPKGEGRFTDIYLIGPAGFVATIITK